MKQRCEFHFSVDDICSTMEHLAQNCYDSVFEEPTLAFFRALHERFGTVFSFYCFYERGSFSLEQVPGSYQAELAANGGWLRFGFHSRAAESKYARLPAEELERDFCRTMQQLKRIAGASALDWFPRIHDFSGGKEAMYRLHGQGMQGAIGSYDPQKFGSYYLSPEQENILQKERYWYDTETGLSFVPTAIRLETTPHLRRFLLLHGWELCRGNVEVFTHEWAWEQEPKRFAEIERVAAWAWKHHFHCTFPIEWNKGEKPYER